jgi:hypothetical protein
MSDTPHPAKPQVARLDVMRGCAPDGDWHVTTGSDGKAYAYRFLGGRKGKGHLHATEEDGKDQRHFVRLGSREHEYAIDDVTFLGDDAGQLKFLCEESNAHEAVILNSNRQSMYAYYCVTVVRDDVRIPCDPMISNSPRNY